MLRVNHSSFCFFAESLSSKAVTWACVTLLMSIYGSAPTRAGKLLSPVSSLACELTLPALEKSKGVVECSFGDQLIGSSVEVSVELTNKLGVDLELQLSSSCSCTTLSEPIQEFKQDEKVTLRLGLRTPSLAGDFNSVVTCVDPKKGLGFRLFILGKSVLPFEMNPKMVEFESSNRMEPISFEFKPVFDGFQFKMASAEMEGVQIESCEVSDVSSKVIVQLDSKAFSQKRFKDNLGLRLSYVRAGSDETKELLLDVPIMFADRMTLGPSSISFKKVGEKWKCLAFLRGRKVGDKFESAKAELNGPEGKRILLDIQNLRTRGEDAVVFDLVTDDKFDVSDSDLAENVWAIHVSMGEVVLRSSVIFFVDRIKGE